MTLSGWLWLALIAYAAHMLEEYELDWRNWARAVIKLPVEWTDFYIVNSIVVVLGIAMAQIGAQCPMVSLAFPALMLINATFFHVAPVLVTRGRYSPGVFTAVVLFYPIGIACYWRAAQDGVLTTQALAGSFMIGALLMAMPIVLLHLKSKPYFRQDK